MSVLRSRFFWKIYSTFALLFLGATLLVTWVGAYKIKGTIRDIVADNLRTKAEFLVPQARSAFQAPGAASSVIQTVNELGRVTGTRVTLIRADGTVISDSDHDPSTMENHWQRPEVQQALHEPFGFSERMSQTLGKPLVYFAMVVKGEQQQVLGVVRVAVSTDKVENALETQQWTMALIACAGIALALAVGWALARRVATPIGEMVQVAEALRSGRYEQKVRTIPDDELGKLGDTLNRLGSELTGKISELQRLETVRRDFVANVSHEIKTPLTSIKGYVETLLAGAIDDPEKRTRFLEKINRNSERLTNLVQDLLSLARIEAGEDTFKPAPVDWAPIVSSVIARNEDSISRKSLRVKVNAPASPLVVLGDKEAMTQVLDNLLTNAIKYTPDGGRITVSLNAKGAWCKLSVEDTGIGIPAEHLDRIFERFYRVDKARSRELGGTGLGLSIVKHLVSTMNGDVKVESAVGVGTTFTVRLKMATPV